MLIILPLLHLGPHPGLGKTSPFSFGHWFSYIGLLHLSTSNKPQTCLIVSCNRCLLSKLNYRVTFNSLWQRLYSRVSISKKHSNFQCLIMYHEQPPRVLTYLEVQNVSPTSVVIDEINQERWNGHLFSRPCISNQPLLVSYFPMWWPLLLCHIQMNMKTNWDQWRKLCPCNL